MVKRSVEEHANTLEKWVKQGKQGSPPVLAATVILLRDGDRGLETLMLRRNSRIVFGGMWVFPGGRVDREDWEGVVAGDELAASRRAAARESIEECGLQVDPDSMLPFSHWTPPLVTPKRFLTWFFVARPREGDVAIDDGEIKESLWMSPEEALRRQNVKEIELAPPTYVTLSELSAFGDVDAALSAIRDRTLERWGRGLRRWRRYGFGSTASTHDGQGRPLAVRAQRLGWTLRVRPSESDPLSQT